MSTTTLLPCPFCGQHPTDYAIEPHTHVLQFAGGKMPDHQGSHVIECACGCGMIEATREAVVAVWNRRPTPAAVCEVMRLVQDYFVTGTDEARDTIESKLRTLLATGREAQAQQPAIMPKGESAAAQLRAMATNYPTGHSWDKLDAKACIRGALEIEALRALQATATGLPAQAVDADEIAATVCQRVAELDDRSSPEEWPEAMSVTGVELLLIVRESIIAAEAIAPQAEADAQDDSALLDAMERRRIAVVPEYEGPWDAEVYDDDGKPNHLGSGSTPREAIRAAIAAAKGE